MEFKKVDTFYKETIDQTVVNALQQIREKQYVAEMKAAGIQSVLGIGIAFEGKKVLVQYESYDL